jgi:thiosulfate/3-mercaptopyruvate sulfurtransferase
MAGAGSAMSAERSSNLVSATWLRKHFDRPELLILDARVGPAETAGGKLTYLSGRPGFQGDGHIPGARFADLNDGFSDPDGAFLFTRPRAEAFARVVRALGIHANSLVVAYDSLSGAWAARVWWVLRGFGHTHVRVLDGGLKAWIEAGGKLEFGAGDVSARPGDFVPVERPDAYVGTTEVLDVVAGRRVAHLICALPRGDFTGQTSLDPRRGHIPGSYNMPFRDMLDASGRIDLARVRQHASRVGLDRADEILLYCGGGINAAGLALALSEAGYGAAKIYDGSLNEWKANPALKLETGPERTQ